MKTKTYLILGVAFFTTGLLAGEPQEHHLINADLLDGLDASQFWQTRGNARTVPGRDFLGTSDTQPLELRVNGQRALRLEPNAGEGPNVIGGSAHNVVDAGVMGATVGGGGGTVADLPYTNRVAADFGTVSGGL